MASVKVELSDQQFQALQDLARKLGIAPEELVRISIGDWLNHPRSDFSQAADYVMHKNSELYERLA